MKRVLYHRIFEPKPFGHGGERRAAQLAEIMKASEIEQEVFPLKGISGWRRPLWSLWLIIKTFGLTIFKHPKRLWKLFWLVSYNYTHNLEDFFARPEKTLLIEGTIEEFQIMFTLAKCYKKEVIAFPHNLESLVPGQKFAIGKGEKWAAFRNEIQCLKQCNAVYCISQEETWLLRLWDVNAYYLPYYPPQETISWLQGIRKERENRVPSGQVLMTGSALNPPTAIGMQQVIDVWNRKDVQLRVGGYGTSEKLHIPSNSNTKLLGQLSEEDMRVEMIECDAIVINQPPTTGALTRIQEALIAGIPIIANLDSARSYHNIEGIKEVCTIDEFGIVNIYDLQSPSCPSKLQNSIFDEIK